MKALKTNDLAYEENITQTVWESTAVHLKETWDVLSKVLPDLLLGIFTEHKTSIRFSIPTLIKGRINQIVQSNLFLMVDSSYLNFSFVSGLYRSLLPDQPTAGLRSHQSLQKTTVSFFTLKPGCIL